MGVFVKWAEGVVVLSTDTLCASAIIVIDGVSVGVDVLVEGIGV